MCEILFLCGSNRKAVIATLSVLGIDNQHSKGISDDEVGFILLIPVTCETSYCKEIKSNFTKKKR